MDALIPVLILLVTALGIEWSVAGRKIDVVLSELDDD